MTDLDDMDEPDVHDLDSVGDEAGVQQLSETEARERLLAATVAHALAQDAQYSGAPAPIEPPVRWWKWFTAIGLVLTALLVLAAPPSFLAGPPAPTLTSQEIRSGVQAALFLQAAAVDAFRLEEGRYPGSLAELDHTLPGIRYVRSGTRAYQLVAPLPDGSVLLWDSADPSPERRGLGRRWLGRPFFP